MTLSSTGDRDSRGGVGDETDADMPEGWNLPGPLHLGRLHQVRVCMPVISLTIQLEEKATIDLRRAFKAYYLTIYGQVVLLINC